MPDDRLVIEGQQVAHEELVRIIDDLEAAIPEMPPELGSEIKAFVEKARRTMKPPEQPSKSS